MNTFIKKTIPTALFLSVCMFSYGQMVYIGLKDEANVRTAQVTLADLRVAGTYWPKTQIIDNHLYVPTLTGIYRKDLSTLYNTNWELYAFDGIPVRKSTDQGMTWSPGTPVPEYIYKVIYDPDNPEILYASGTKHGPDESVRIYRSTDGGDSWHVFYEEVIEIPTA